jgi:thiol-disulfide isomerase/thioredoxin
MDAEVGTRLLITVSLLGVGALAFLLFNRFTLRRAESKVSRLPTYRQDIPAIVYFTTPTCAPCKTYQRPMLRKMQEKMGEWLQVIEIDASTQPELAQEWGVVSVPTTFVIDAKGEPKFVNHGIASAEKLLQQLEIEDYSI